MVISLSSCTEVLITGSGLESRSQRECHGYICISLLQYLVVRHHPILQAICLILFGSLCLNLKTPFFVDNTYVIKMDTGTELCYYTLRVPSHKPHSVLVVMLHEEQTVPLPQSWHGS